MIVCILLSYSLAECLRDYYNIFSSYYNKKTFKDGRFKSVPLPPKPLLYGKRFKIKTTTSLEVLYAHCIENHT